MDDKNIFLNATCKNYYKHFVSLGYFCSVASELERMGLRSISMLFDWCISSIQGVVTAIETKFDSFMEYSNMQQNSKNPLYYKDEYYDFMFFHDFNNYTPLIKQLKNVKEKYNRRIGYFYNAITEPTLFIRYISDEKTDTRGRSIELNYIEENYDKILNLLRKYNGKNDIIFIANTGVVSDKIKIYSVDPDENDIVARKPFDKNDSLKVMFNSFEIDKKEDNLKRFRAKQKKYNIKKLTHKKYIHNKQYD